MGFAPWTRAAFFSRVAEWEPRGLRLTGTPRAAAVDDGDAAGRRIGGFPELRNPVRRLRSTD
jgi:hypothetical protein